MCKTGMTGKANDPAALELLEPRLLLSCTLSGGVWKIRGDCLPGQLDDQIVVRTSATDPDRLEAVVNGQTAGSVLLSKVRSIRVYGGKGSDEIRIDLPASAAHIRAWLYGQDGGDVLSGGPGDDRLSGGAGDDLLYGGPGKDVIVGGPGSDRLYGQDGSDRLYSRAGADILYGGDGDDKLFGGAGADALLGGEGRDYLNGGAGRDLLYGKATDRFRAARRDVKMGDPAESRLRTIQSIEEFRQRVIDIALQNYGYLLGTRQVEWPWWVWYDRYTTWDGVRILTAAGPGGDSLTVFRGTELGVPSATNSYSGTNNQVAGVDEADLVKTDGDYIYMIAGGELLIIDALPADQIRVVARLPIQGQAMNVFLFGDRLAVTSMDQSPYLIGPVGPPIRILDQPVTDPDSSDEQQEDDEDGDEWIIPEPWDGSQVRFTVYDISDRGNPTVAQETVLNGWVVDARAIGDQVYLVMRDELAIPGPAYRIEESPLSPEPVEYDRKIIAAEGAMSTLGILRPVIDGWADPPMRRLRVYETAEQYTARLQQMALEELLPTYAAGDAERLLAEPVGIYLPEDSLSADLLMLVRMDLSAEQAGPADVTTIQGADGQVYASPESLYVVARKWTPDPDAEAPGASSRIYKFDLADPDAPLVATGIVAGTINNQFSLDEYGDEFRIATTSWTVRGGTSNNLFVLEQEGADLIGVGALTGLAAGESIYSVRYMGELAYVVTFRQVDPLFVIDLGDPTSPTVVGELKVPGFSSYLHPIDEGHLIGVGRDATETGWVRGLRLSLFDVTDPSRPAEVDAMLLAEGDSWWQGSEALWDHHAFSYFDEYGVLALPVDQWGLRFRSSLRVVAVDPEAGFTDLGRIAQDSRIRRSIRINDNVYAISAEQITVAELLCPANVVATLNLSK